MQPMRIGGKAPGWRVHSFSRPNGSHGGLTDYHHLGPSSAVRLRGQTSAETVCFCYFVDLVNYGTGCRTTPCGTSPVVTNRHSAMSSLRASATIMVSFFLPAATPA